MNTPPPTTLAWVCARHTARVQRLFDRLDLDLPALARVKAAVAAGNLEAACAALADYYRICASGQWLRHATVPEGSGTDPAAGISGTGKVIHGAALPQPNKSEIMQ